MQIGRGHVTMLYFKGHFTKIKNKLIYSEVKPKKNKKKRKRPLLCFDGQHV